MRSILVTGFEPFGGDSRNPSGETAVALNGRVLSGHVVRGAVLPCVFGDSLRELRRLLAEVAPAAVVCLGVAADRDAITPEQVAINLDDARIPDNAGAQPSLQPVIEGGPPTYPTTLPATEIIAALRDQGFPARISESAGTFVCNHVFYGLMHDLRHRPEIPAGFIHVPASTVLEIDAMVTAITLAIETTLRAGSH
jgi:Pyrrolidone-carboxylate peptidase (N-terminal pyroglutamyl peptidase)